MKSLLSFFVVVICVNFSFGQKDSTAISDTTTYRFVKTDGGEILGKIISQDAREILIKTQDNRQIYIPQHTIKVIEAVNFNNYNAKGTFIGEDKFATRYFLTTNGLPIKKGEHYVQFNLFGPDVQFGVANNFGIGVMTTWIGIPFLATFKYSVELGEKAQFAIGGILGTGSWAAPDWGGALPFGTFSFGDRSKNIAFSAGYGAVWQDGVSEGRTISSVAAMVKISSKVSLVFDSFILLRGKTTYTPYSYYTFNPSTGNLDLLVTGIERNEKRGGALLIPGLRWHIREGNAFQFGFSGVIADGDAFPVPIPMVQWYRSL